MLPLTPSSRPLPRSGLYVLNIRRRPKLRSPSHYFANTKRNLSLLSSPNCQAYSVSVPSKAFLDLVSELSGQSLDSDPLVQDDPSPYVDPIERLALNPVLRYCLCFSLPVLHSLRYCVTDPATEEVGSLSAVPAYARGRLRLQPTTSFVSAGEVAGNVSRLGSNVCLSLTRPLLRIGDPSRTRPLRRFPPLTLRSCMSYGPTHCLVLLATSLNTPPNT